ncbi:uncharacterized protein LAJ45_03638 [Morchella importuna]|uniref:uncharacterized protein n=1 Tax=Morchella importuna TaxID=1174673 RepID=UPI001E8D60B1|nr:uncharacterized protein LAJ45_03638 [Morchella importuna]KAH8152212.1 hypothetical protein LAJ45_03638 [Morchella importuna]
MCIGYRPTIRRGTGTRSGTLRDGMQSTSNSTRNGRAAVPDPSPSEPSVHSDEEDLEEEDEALEDGEAVDDDEELVDDEAPEDEKDDGSESPAAAGKRTRKAAPRAAATKSKKAAPQKTKKAPTKKAPKKAPLKTSAKGTHTSGPERRIKTEPGASPEVQLVPTAPADQQTPTIANPSTVDAATNTLPLLPPAGITVIVIDGHAFEVPADPVACFHAVRQQVIASYRAIAARNGTERDLAVAMGTGAAGGGGEVCVAGKMKRASEGPEGEEGCQVKRWKVQVGYGGDGGNVAGVEVVPVVVLIWLGLVISQRSSAQRCSRRKP